MDVDDRLLPKPLDLGLLEERGVLVGSLRFYGKSLSHKSNTKSSGGHSM